MSTVIEIADALKDELNQAPGGTFSQDFKAVRNYLPRVKPEDIADALSVKIIPTGDDRTLASRSGAVARDVPVDIGIQKKLGAGVDPSSETANAEMDSLVTFVEELADYLRPGKKMARGVILRTSVDPVFSVEHLAQHSIFTSVVTVLVKVP